MARKVTWGTPGRSKSYVRPRPAYAFVRPSLVGALGLLAIFAVVQVLGARRVFEPGPVIGAHAGFETSCESCHAPRQGASNARCQRCHDPSGAGRLDNRAHVLFGSGDTKKAAAAPRLVCATCHVEHGGRAARLTAVDAGACVRCHFRSFRSHPEFAALRASTPGTPGLRFGHGPVEGFRGHVQEVMVRKKLSATQACLTCHEPEGRDLQPLSFSRHCASCHNANLQPTVGIPEMDVARAAVDETELTRARGRVAKTVVRHQDEWILASLRQLHREVAPEAYAAEHAALAGEVSRLRRRLALATPLATLSEDELASRMGAIDLEIAGLEARLSSLGRAQGAAATRAREVSAALSASTHEVTQAAAAALARDVTDAPAAAGGVADFAGHRQQVLDLLEASLSADLALAPRIDDLRRRVLALSPRDDPRDVLSRALEQRQFERARAADETALRAGGALPPVPVVLLEGQAALQRALEAAEERLRRLEIGTPAVALDAETRARKLESADLLAASCVKCHLVENAALAPVRAARPVLLRAGFAHRPHLVQTDCLHCHESIQKSAHAGGPSFPGVVSCQECHRPNVARQDCMTCHHYHAPARP